MGCTKDTANDELSDKLGSDIKLSSKTYRKLVKSNHNSLWKIIKSERMSRVSVSCQPRMTPYGHQGTAILNLKSLKLQRPIKNAYYGKVQMKLPIAGIVNYCLFE